MARVAIDGTGVREARRRLGVGQAVLAERLAAREPERSAWAWQSALSRLERGVTEGTAERFAAALAAELGTAVTAVAGGTLPCRAETRQEAA